MPGYMDHCSIVIQTKISVRIIPLKMKHSATLTIVTNEFCKQEKNAYLDFSLINYSWDYYYIGSVDFARLCSHLGVFTFSITIIQES